MDARLRVRIALHAHRLARSLARARVGLRPLSAHRQSAQMPDAPVTLDALQPLQIHAQLAAKIALNHILPVLDRVDYLRHLLLIQVLGPDARINLGLFQDDLRVDRADAVNITKRDVDSLSAGNFHSDDACHILLSLPLFVARIRANHTNDALALDHLAIFAKLLY